MDLRLWGKPDRRPQAHGWLDREHNNGHFSTAFALIDECFA
jgi:hypothetical protein